MTEITAETPKRLFREPPKWIFEQIRAQREVAEGHQDRVLPRKPVWQMYYFELKAIENHQKQKKAQKIKIKRPRYSFCRRN